MNKILIYLLLISSFIYGQETKYHSPYSDLENGEYYYLFGHDVAFRTEPDKKSKVLDVLKIGTEIQVIEKSVNSIKYFGNPTSYYKVKHNNQVGYILGGLISLEKREMGDSKYFFTYGKEEDKFYLIIRHVNGKSVLSEDVAELTTNDFSLEIYSNKGVEGVEKIIFINYLAEACGVDGGGIYMFQVNNILKKVF